MLNTISKIYNKIQEIKIRSNIDATDFTRTMHVGFMLLL